MNDFQNPPSSYRSAPFWVWNDNMTEELIKNQLNELANNGFGGAFIHPRPGLVTEYLSEEWFSLWEYALDEAKKLGILLYIYDENSYPSGFAGGHVPSELPDYPARGVHISYYNNIEDPHTLFADASIPEASYKRPIKIYVYSEEGNQFQLIKDVTNIHDTEWKQYGTNFLTVEWVPIDYTPWLGGFAYPDLLRKEVAHQFIETTYKPYFERFGDSFGSNIPAIFTDEPGIAPGSVFSESNRNLPFSYFLATEFRERNGYDLIEHLVWLFVDPAEEDENIPSSKVRFDYYCTIRELWIKNFIEPISIWCKEKGISWTGHFFEHQWPHPWGQCAPAVMSLYEYMGWPGIDMLMTYLLKNEDFNPLMINIKEASSAAHQLNKEKVLCEVYGAGGWDATFEDFKRIADWLAVHGITFFNQHLTFSTIVGARKRDHPQSFDWREPWWKEYKNLADYMARICYVMNNSKQLTRILVLHPTTSWFTKPASSQQGNMLWEWDKVPPNSPLKRYAQFLEFLQQQQIDFDFGDEFILERHASVIEGVCKVGHAEYDLIIVPEAMENMNKSTFHLLEQFMSSGGEVISVDAKLRTIDGLPSLNIDNLKQHENWKTVSMSHLIGQLKQQDVHTIEVEVSEQVRGVAHRHKQLSDGTEVLFMINSSPEEYLLEIEVATNDSVTQLNLHTGDYDNLELVAASEGNRRKTCICLPPIGSVMLNIKRKNNSVAKISIKKNDRNAIDSSEEVELQETSVKLNDLNVLVLDYCDLHLETNVFENINVIPATDKIFKHHGLQSNPWDRTIQYKRRYLDKTDFGAKSGYVAKFYFQVQDLAIKKDLRVAVERAEFHELYVNGHKVTWADGEHWLDHHIGVAYMSDFVKEGLNEISLVAKSFHITLELEQIYVLGHFAIENIEDEFYLSTTNELRRGSLADQGYPFYGGKVQYLYEFTLTKVPSRAQLIVGNWQGTTSSVMVNGKNIGSIGAGNKLTIDEGLKSGLNKVEIDLYCSLKNVLGPFHDQSKPRNIAWPAHWKTAPSYGRPNASLYDVIHYGIFDQVKIIYQ